MPGLCATLSSPANKHTNANKNKTSLAEVTNTKWRFATTNRSRVSIRVKQGRVRSRLCNNFPYI